MYIRTIGVAVLVVSGLVAGLPAQSKTFPVSELKPGMVATGRTVFQGDQLEEFKAHILGVLHNSIGPRRDLILARLEGGPLANTGVIAGMSGSPVYIDGRLVGAVSYSLGEFCEGADRRYHADRRDDRGRDVAWPAAGTGRARASSRFRSRRKALRESLRQAFAWARPFAESPADVQRHRWRRRQRRHRDPACARLPRRSISQGSTRARSTLSSQRSGTSASRPSWRVRHSWARSRRPPRDRRALRPDRHCGQVIRSASR